jgi:hypothetical protein
MQKHPDRPYQLVVSCGTAAAPQLDGVKVIDLAVASDTLVADASPDTEPVHPVIAALTASTLNSGDVRSRILFMVDPAVSAETAVSAYAAFSAFCGRRVDASCGAERLGISNADIEHRNTPDAGKIAPLDLVVVGEGEIPASLEPESIHRCSAELSAADISAIRQAKRALVFLASAPLEAVGAFAKIASLRARNDAERFPIVVANGVVIDTDELRKLAADARRLQRTDQSVILAPKATLAMRSRDMLAACAVPVEAVMVALGSTTPGEGLWHCPRPHRHANGDANASMKVERGKARCFRCDAERVDSVRLVADSRSWTADEATEWILQEVAPSADALVATVADRLPVPAED